MGKLLVKGLLQKNGWLENVEVTTDDDGQITSIEPTESACSDFALPGFRNAHSHAFQYAMAGTAENHTNPDDDFWSWREAMYGLALEIEPDEMEGIAAFVYSEMLRHGITHVAEFHYLHNDPKGAAYTNPAEMGSRLVAAAAKTGINITLVPVYYNLGGFGLPPTERQRRFISKTVDDYLKLVEASASACADYVNARIGFGIHSLRAASLSDLSAIVDNGPADAPFHIHVAEQLKEVEECVNFYGARPVECLFDNIEPNRRFNLVHATYVVESELNRIAKSGANVVICPTTEGNLGDGIFSFKHLRALGGNWSIGTDSNVSLNPFEEFRLLDYGQRLVARSRNTFGESGSMFAVTKAFDAGQNAMGNGSGDFFEIGKPLNACLISSTHPIIAAASVENRLNTILYSSDESMQAGSITSGVWSTDSTESEKILNEFTRIIKSIRNR